MSSLKEVENQMKLASWTDDPDIAKAYRLVVLFFAYLDKTGSTNHCKIIEELYHTKPKRYTLNGIALRMNISDKTLKRYRENYANCFLFYLTGKILGEEATVTKPPTPTK